jgi:acyl carrier protein
MDEIKNRIRQFILTRYLPGELPANLTDDTPLRTSGVLDSMATLAVVDFVEKEFSIELEAHETGVERFDSVGAIAQLVSEKQAQSGAGRP